MPSLRSRIENLKLLRAQRPAPTDSAIEQMMRGLSREELLAIAALPIEEDPAPGRPIAHKAYKAREGG
jgi:hypothetical protein